MNNLKELRIAAGLSQEALARKMDINRATIDNWEKGRTEPTARYIKQMAEIFGVSADEILKEV